MNISQMMYYKQLKGYSYDKLSELSGIPKGTIQKIFTGVTKSPRYDTLQALERVLSPEQTDMIDMVAEAPAYHVKRQGEYTLEDYYALPEERRVELIDGVIYDMTAPTTVHQTVALQMAHQIENYIEEHGGNCVPFIAPVDVQLDCDDRTMVQPDVIILCDLSKNINRCIYGAPDFVVEVLSPSTRKKDLRIKLAKYAAAGVREYWMVDPEKRQVIVYWFEPSDSDEKSDTVTIYGFDEQIPVQIYNGDLRIDFGKIAKKLERIQSVRK